MKCSKSCNDALLTMVTGMHIRKETQAPYLPRHLLALFVLLLIQPI